jgi:hypothetical protein
MNEDWHSLDNVLDVAMARLNFRYSEPSAFTKQLEQLLKVMQLQGFLHQFK